MANAVTVGDSASTELNVANAGLLNGITNYDHMGGYTIKDTADAVSKSSVAILGDSDSVTLSDVANAAQGALINGFDKGESTTDITFSVKDTAANLAANAANLDVANAVTIEDSASTELNVANAGLLNGIPNYDNKGAYDQGHCRCGFKSSVEIGDAVSVTLSDVANAAQGHSSMGSIRARAPRISHLTLKIPPPILLPRQRTWMWLKRLALVVLATTRLVCCRCQCSVWDRQLRSSGRLHDQRCSSSGCGLHEGSSG